MKQVPETSNCGEAGIACAHAVAWCSGEISLFRRSRSPGARTPAGDGGQRVLPAREVEGIARKRQGRRGASSLGWISRFRSLGYATVDRIRTRRAAPFSSLISIVHHSETGELISGKISMNGETGSSFRTGEGIVCSCQSRRATNPSKCLVMMLIASVQDSPDAAAPTLTTS